MEMGTPQCRVVLTGKLVIGSKREEVINALGTLLKQPHDKVARMLGGPPVPIKQLFDCEKAERIRQRIEAAGAHCTLERVEPEPLGLELGLDPVPPPPPRPTPPPSGGSKFSLELEPVAAAEGEVASDQGQEPVGERCPKCGHPKGSGDLCEGCGIFFSKLAPSAVPAFTSPPPAGVPNTPARPVSEVASTDYGEFIGPNLQRYLEQFEKFRIGGGGYAFTWHWPAFLVPFYWALYRKLWGWAALFLVVDILAAIFIPFFSGTITHVGSAVVANYLYFRHVKRKVEAIRATSTDDVTAVERMNREGGTSILAVWAGIALLLLSSFLLGTWLASQFADEMGGLEMGQVLGDNAVVESPEGQQTTLTMNTLSFSYNLWKMGNPSGTPETFWRQVIEPQQEPPLDGWDQPIGLEDGTLISYGPDGEPYTGDDILQPLVKGPE